MKVYDEPAESGESIFHSNELARSFFIVASARKALERHAASERIRRTLSGILGFDWTSRSKLLVWWKGILVRTLAKSRAR